MDWEWDVNIHLDVDVNILMCIAKHNRDAWKLFSVLNKELSKVFNPLSYEMQFREIVENNNYKMYFLDGKLHRSGGPARKYRHKPGKWDEWEWFRHGEKHREGGPAHYNIDGEEQWYINNRLHRIDGPAYIFIETFTRLWFLHGKEYPEGMFNNIIARYRPTNSPVPHTKKLNGSLIIQHGLGMGHKHSFGRRRKHTHVYSQT